MVRWASYIQLPAAEAEEAENRQTRPITISADRGGEESTSIRQIARQEVRKEAKRGRPTHSSSNSSNSGRPSAKESKGQGQGQAKLPWCGQFNTTGCTNPKVGPDGCRGPNGKLYVHSCKVDVNGGKCGAWDHNANNCPNK